MFERLLNLLNRSFDRITFLIPSLLFSLFISGMFYLGGMRGSWNNLVIADDKPSYLVVFLGVFIVVSIIQVAIKDKKR